MKISEGNRKSKPPGQDEPMAGHRWRHLQPKASRTLFVTMGESPGSIVPHPRKWDVVAQARSPPSPFRSAHDHLLYSTSARPSNPTGFTASPEKTMAPLQHRRQRLETPDWELQQGGDREIPPSRKNGEKVLTLLTPSNQHRRFVDPTLANVVEGKGTSSEQLADGAQPSVRPSPNIFTGWTRNTGIPLGHSPPPAAEAASREKANRQTRTERSAGEVLLPFRFPRGREQKI
jgi:hypothetical protein